MSEPGATHPQRTILIVDDDESTLQMLTTFLSRNGYKILSSTNPLQAIELLKTEPVHLVITDLMMPHVDGIGFTQQIHALPGYAGLPVIMITAYGNDAVTDQGMRKGVALTLPKPLELNKLLDLVGFATH